MTRARLAVNVSITVLGTLLIAALGYMGMASTVAHRTADIHPVAAASPSPSPPLLATPSPTAAPPAAPSTVGRRTVSDEDIPDQEDIWLLLSDCNSEGPSTCHYYVARSGSGGTWSSAVAVGPPYSSTDGDAPRTIRFLDGYNGFVYGHSGAFVTHDGGVTWADAGFHGEVVGIAAFEKTAWVVNRPCAKGVVCPYEVRSSHDGGASWSPPHQLPAVFGPESLAAFASGVIVASLPPGDLEVTADQGATWTDIKTPCGADQFRGHATTANGIEIWLVCLGYPDANGVIDSASIVVTRDAGRTWSRVSIPGVAPRWLVSPKPTVALADGNGFILLSRDSGATWSRVAMGDGAFAPARFTSPDWGWATDVTRHVWWTFDGGSNWFPGATLPSTLP